VRSFSVHVCVCVCVYLKSAAVTGVYLC
jgi:hypothetical protein